MTDVVLRLEPISAHQHRRRAATGDRRPDPRGGLPVGRWRRLRGRGRSTGGRAHPRSRPRRIAHQSRRRGGGAVVHDRRLETDAALAAATSRAAELSTANARLQAELRNQVAAVRASRLRIVEAGDEERRALGHRLAAGLVPGLDELDRGYASAPTGLGDAGGRRHRAIMRGARRGPPRARSGWRTGCARVRWRHGTGRGVGSADGPQPPPSDHRCR